MITRSVEETREAGRRLADRLRAGDVLLLEGELGTGKSELTRGIAKGLGVRETVTSPSFTILNVYESGRLPLYHFDWYRLESEEELYELGMDEYLGGDGIAVVEWPGRCPEAVPEGCFRIRLESLGENIHRMTPEPADLLDEMTPGPNGTESASDRTGPAPEKNDRAPEKAGRAPDHAARERTERPDRTERTGGGEC